VNVVFDFGGVLFRWQPHEFMPRLLPAHARNEETTAAVVADFFQGFGGDWGEFDRGAADQFRVAHRIAFRTGIDVADVQRVIDAIPSELLLMPHSLPLIQRLKGAGHRLFFLSNMPRPYAEHLERVHPLHDWFEAGLFSSRIDMVKPEPAIFHHAATTFGIEPRESVFIDDYALNVKAARALGWNAIHFLSAAQCDADLAKLGL
jgi:putative hydrolase of the HAD superfamily